MSKGRMVGGFIAAVLVTLTVASFVHTQFILAGLRAVGAEVPASATIATVAGDWLGLAPAFGAVIAIALLLGFLITAAVRRFVGVPRPIAFALAGGVALGTTLSLMRLSYEITPIASARDWDGFLALCAAGGLGGLVFASVSRDRTMRRA